MTILAGKVDGADVRNENQVMARELFHLYEVYGICLRTALPLPLPDRRNPGGLIQVEILLGSADLFADLIRDTPLKESPYRNFFYVQLQDGSSYVRWHGLGEFLVSTDGRRITCRRFDEALLESFQVYLLGQAISLALVKNAFEPLHATCVVIDGKAVALLGESGYGKSSLAACFLEAGHRLLTDDLLVLREIPGGFQAYPGPPRIKLFSQMARRFLGESIGGVPMNSDTRKLIMPLGPARVCSHAAPLEAIYAIAAPREGEEQQRVHIQAVSSREAFVLLMNNAFNYIIADPQRLQRQFDLTARVANAAPVKKLSYPRLSNTLPLVREAIVADLHHI